MSGLRVNGVNDLRSQICFSETENKMLNWIKKLCGRETKKEERDLCKMSDDEKRQFLSMDLIERMIRVEQRVGASFNEHLSYNKTVYYKSLKKHEKEKFKKYLRKNKRMKFVATMFLLGALISPFFLKAKFSGFAVRDASQVSFALLDKGLILFVLGVTSIALIFFVLNKSKKRKFEKHFNIIDRVALKNYLRK